MQLSVCNFGRGHVHVYVYHNVMYMLLQGIYSLSSSRKTRQVLNSRQAEDAERHYHLSNAL